MKSIGRKNQPGLQKLATLFFFTATIVLLYLSHYYNYLLFHSTAELFSIVIAFTLFIITWNSSKYIENPYLLLIGIAYFFIGTLDLLHTLSYKGMQIFKDYDYYANQLWIIARFMESLTLAAGFFFFLFKKRTNRYLIFTVYLVITIILVLSVFVWKIFPICFTEGIGQTTFKIYSEYIICLILFISGLLLFFPFRSRFTPPIFRLLMLSIVFTIISELAFTIYISNYGLSNLIGHFMKIFSFYLIYKAIIETGINEPYELIFKELNAHKTELEKRVTEEVQKNLEKDKILHFQARRAALGEMIGNVAHQWNQPLTALSIMIQTMGKQIEQKSLDPEVMRQKNKKMLEIISFMSQTVNDFRNFFKKDKEKSFFNVCKVCKRVQGIIEGSLVDNSIRLEIRESEETIAYGFENEYAQVILNLLVNAKDALVLNRTSDPRITIDIGRVNEKAVVKVEDNAGGIPEAVLGRLFDSYYSTKENGTGMGLFMSRKIMDGMDGTISAANTQTGARFTVML